MVAEKAIGCVCLLFVSVCLFNRHHVFRLPGRKSVLLCYVIKQYSHMQDIK